MLLFFKPAGATIPLYETNNNDTSELNGRIVGGQVTTIESFPWIVSLQHSTRGHFCGGSIITPNRILTAAHCTLAFPTSAISVRAGSTYRQSGGQLVPAAYVVNHPWYNAQITDNDISVIWLSWYLNLVPGVAIIGLPGQYDGVATGITAYVAGWGALCSGCVDSPNLRFVGVPVITNAECIARHVSVPHRVITNGMLCAGFPEGGRDACQNDSGGPLTVGGTLVGVVSWGIGCAAPGFPGVYARVAFFRNWINASI